LCQDLAEFDGDDADSTDVVLEMNVEIDGQWGPYLLCNPVNVSESTGPWFCVTHMNYNIPDYPEECVAENIVAIPNMCMKD